MSLIEYLQDVTPYRTIFNGTRHGRDHAVACYSDELAAARAWSAKNIGKPPLLVVLDAPARQPDTIIPGALLRRPELMLFVFGKTVRRKAAQLAQRGIREFTFCEDPRFPNHKYDAQLFKNRRRMLEQVFDRMADEESRRTFASLVKHRVTGNHGYMRIAEYAQYRHPQVQARAGDWVCDCGALTGATSFRFARQVGAQGHVFAFEPDPVNHATMQAKLRSRPAGDAPITLLNVGVSDAPGELRFMSAKAGSSKVSERGDTVVRVETLDSFAQHYAPKGQGLLSFDIEGFERQALTGGEAMIKALRPKLQVSIYHKATDLYRLPLWAMDRLPRYRFYMGHHDAHHSETDLYAIPEEACV